jgi:hypothetical protein
MFCYINDDLSLNIAEISNNNENLFIVVLYFIVNNYISRRNPHWPLHLVALVLNQ